MYFNYLNGEEGLIGSVKALVYEFLMKSNRNAYIRLSKIYLNKDFVKFVDKFNLTLAIRDFDIIISGDKIEFLYDFSNKYPKVFSYIFIRKIAGEYVWNNIDSFSNFTISINYRINEYVRNYNLILNKSFAVTDEDCVKKTRVILENLDSEAIITFLHKQSRNLITRYKDENGDIYLQKCYRKLFRTDESLSEYCKKLESTEKWNRIDDINSYDKTVCEFLRKEGESISVYCVDGKVIYHSIYIKGYKPHYPSLSSFRRCLDITKRVLFGREGKVGKNQSLFIKANKGWEIVPILPMINKRIVQSSINRVLFMFNLIQKFKHEAPMIGDAAILDNRCIGILSKMTDEEIKMVMSNYIDEKVVQSLGGIKHMDKMYIQNITSLASEFGNNVAKKIMLTDLDNRDSMYNAYLRIDCLSKHLELSDVGNMSRRLGYAFYKEDAHIRMDDLFFDIVKSFAEKNNIKDIERVYDVLYGIDYRMLRSSSLNETLNKGYLNDFLRDYIYSFDFNKIGFYCNVNDDYKSQIYLENPMDKFDTNELTNAYGKIKNYNKSKISDMSAISIERKLKKEEYQLYFSNTSKTLYVYARYREDGRLLIDYLRSLVSKNNIRKIILVSDYFTASVGLQKMFHWNDCKVKNAYNMYLIYEKDKGFKFSTSSEKIDEYIVAYDSEEKRSTDRMIPF